MDEKAAIYCKNRQGLTYLRTNVQSYDDLLSSFTPVIIALCNIGSQKSGNYDGLV